MTATTTLDFDRLLAKAEAASLEGWDFSWQAKPHREPEPWDFGTIVSEQARTARRLLDLGTGGGEWLSRLAHRAPFHRGHRGLAAQCSCRRSQSEGHRRARGPGGRRAGERRAGGAHGSLGPSSVR